MPKPQPAPATESEVKDAIDSVRTVRDSLGRLRATDKVLCGNGTPSRDLQVRIRRLESEEARQAAALAQMLEAREEAFLDCVIESRKSWQTALEALRQARADKLFCA